MITTFVEDPEAGEVSRRTAYIRNNGLRPRQVQGPAELHDPLEPLRAPRLPGAAERPGRRVEGDRTSPTGSGRDAHAPDAAQPAGFGCPCHGGQYDNEGNRTAGPPVRALDRYDFSIVNGHLVLGKRFSVAQGRRARAQDAKITKYKLHGPGQHVDGLEGWLYPIRSPRI